MPIDVSLGQPAKPLSVPVVYTNDQIAFRFTDIVAPEGTLRITMWRPVQYGQSATYIDFPELPVLSTAPTYSTQSTTVWVGGEKKQLDAYTHLWSHTPQAYTFVIDHTVLAKLPVYRKQVERWFSEATIDDFDLDLYDTPTMRDLIEQPAGLELGGKYLGAPALAGDINRRLFTSFMKPADDIDLYCKIELLEKGATQWKTVVTGKAQNAIEGENRRLYHRLDAIYLNRLTNREYDAELFWNVKFVHLALAGLAAVPAEASAADDGSSYYLPFFNYPIFGSQPGPYPFERQGNFTIWQQVAEEAYVANDNTLRHWIWPRHINGALLIKTILGAAYGTTNFEFECDDSEFTFTGARLSWDQQSITDDIDATYERTPNLADGQPVKNWLLLPMCLFGYWDSILPNIFGNDPVPIPKALWYKRFQTAWEIILEIAYLNGWVVKCDIGNGDKVKVAMRRRRGSGRLFTTIVPHEDKHTAFPESESGISVGRFESFQNAIANRGFFDDWYASKIKNVNGTIDVVQNTSSNPQANPYVVPATAQNPAKYLESLCFGDESGRPGVVKPGLWEYAVGWYGTYALGSGVFGGSTIYGALACDSGKTSLLHVDSRTSVDFPMLAPLIYHGSGIGDPDVPADAIPVMFKPVLRGYFMHVTKAGDEIKVTADSYRQLLARFYSLYFVKSDRKIARKYSTITQFEDVSGTPQTNSNYGTMSFDNIDLFFETEILPGADKLPGESDYWVKMVERDFNTWETSAEFDSAGRGISPFDDGDFQDGSEETGTNPGTPPHDNSPNDHGIPNP